MTIHSSGERLGVEFVQAERVESRAGQLIRVVVIDDEQSIVEGFCAILRMHGFEADGFTSPRAALRHLQDRAADMVVIDMLMPEIDGIEVIASIRRHHPATRVVAMSGGGRWVSSGDCLSMAEGLGAHRTLEKPVQAATLVETLRALVC